MVTGRATESHGILQLPARAATIHAEAILSLLDTDLTGGLVAWRAAPWLAASIVRSYLEEELPDSFGIFNPHIVVLIERIKEKLQEA